MPAAAAGRDTIEALLKEYYIPPVVRQISDEVLMLNRLEATKDGIVQGQFAVVPLDFGRTGGIGPARERGALPTAGNQTFERAEYDLKYLYGRGGVSGPSMATTASDAGSFLRILKTEVDGLQRDLRNDLARQVYGDYELGKADAGTGFEVDASAAIAKIATDSGSGVFVLTSDEPLIKGHIYPGMVLDTTDNFHSIENGAPMVVESVDPSVPNVTFVADEVGADAGDYFVLSNSIDAGGNAGVTGLSAIVSEDSPLGGIDPADQAEWASLVEDVSGSFDSDDLHAVWNRVRIKSGNEPKSIVTTFGIIRSYFKELQNQVQFVEPMKLEGGFRVLNFMDKPFIGDVDCNYGTIYLVDEAAIKVFATGDFAPLDEDGHFLKWVTGYDMWEWALARYMELGATRRNSSAKLIGITDLGY